MNPILVLGSAAAASIPPALIAPFVLLLLLIAVMPLTPARAKHIWEHYYPHIAIGLGVLVAGFYLLRMPGGAHTVTHTLHEYFSFIVLIGTLFVVSGGIHINVKGEATPLANITFLAVGAVLANFIGTTGASMVLIRPYIRMNKIRISAFHIVFFIFVVSNCGGALTPIGDPPLFLGYLRGVPFFWLIDHIVAEWLFTVGLILAVFYMLDRRSFAHAPRNIQERIREHDTWRFQGLGNLLPLLAIIGAVLYAPATWFIREAVMLAAAAASYRLTPKTVHEQNAFTFGPIREVAFLFIGIFMTMMPALGYLAEHGKAFGLDRPAQYYFASGSLSAVLDNAPTYLNFLQLAQATFTNGHDGAASAGADEADSGATAESDGVALLLRDHPQFVVAISLGSVFFGAMTYIGNGPNFMVKSIAESAHVKVPTFFGYVLRYSLPILLPILAAAGFIFLRH